MQFRYIFTMLLVLGSIVSAQGQVQQTLPDHLYPGLEYVFSLSQSAADLDPEQLSGLINFVGSTPTESSMVLKERRGAAGAFHGFSVKGDLARVLDYAYNPDIPAYVTMPSSVQKQKWLTPQLHNVLRNMPRNVESTDDIRLLRGREHEVITPDTHTGGYYAYNQDRIVTLLAGPTGSVLISATIQSDLSEVGKKGCIIGDDKDWNYLYSKETGLNKFGLGWVSSYMYYAHSVIIYVADSAADMVHVGSFKWLNGGWAKMNMVKSSHILKGIKRFALDFKAVLEAPDLPDASVLADKYTELLQSSEQSLRQMVSPYLQALENSGSPVLRSNPFKNLLASGEYLQQMSREEMVKVLLLEYIKGCIGKKPLLSLASQSPQIQTSGCLL
jgi:hypothetical protein